MSPPESSNGESPAHEMQAQGEPAQELPAAEVPSAGPVAAIDPTPASEATGDIPVAPLAPAAKTKAARRPIDPQLLATIARGLAVWVLLGFALVSWVRFSWGSKWLVEYLRDNRMEMDRRVVFIVQIFAGGALSALAASAVLFFRRRRAGATEQFERWAWFCSPLILLPALPFLGSVDVWRDNYNVLLPIVLFGAILLEFFVAHALSRPPALVTQFVRGLREEVVQNHGRFGAWLKKYGFLTLIVVAALSYAAFMSFYTIRWHHKLGSAIFDLGINNNLFAGGLHGKINYSPVIFPDEPAKYWANHVKLGLYLFLPIYAAIPKPETLLVIQSVSLGLGAIPLFLFGRRYIAEWLACIVALAYLSYYPLHGANFYEMKEPPTAAAFVLTMIWAIDVKRFKTAWVFFFCALIMREDMPICLAVTGLFLLWSGYRPRTGLVMTAIATTWFIFIRFKVMVDAGSWWFPSMYKDLYSAPDTGFRSVLKTLISNPSFVLKHIFVEKKFWYVMHLLVPVAFLPARRWYLWAAFVPGAILTLLITDYDPPLMFSFQYVMYWAPYLFIAAILAVAALGREHPLGSAKATGAVLGLAFASFGLSYNYGAFARREGSFKSGFHHIRFDWTAQDEATYANVVKVVDSIPADASVSASEKIGAHLSGRENFYTLRRGTHDADFVVTRRSELRLDRTRESITEALEGDKYGVHARFGEFVVLKRGDSPAKNAALLQEWGLSKKPKRPKKGKPPEQKPEQDDDKPENNGEPNEGATE